MRKIVKKRYPVILLLTVLCIAGCSGSTVDNTATEAAASKTVDSNEGDTTGEEKTGSEKFDSKAEFTDLRIGDTVCLASLGPEDTWQYKFTLNSVEYADGEINGLNGDGDGFIILDITLEGVGPDVSYGIVLTDLYIGRSSQFQTEQQEDYGLNAFSNADEVLKSGDEVRGKIAVRYDKHNLTVEKRGMMTTKFIYTVDESEIKGYISGEQ